jgi:DNA-binding transcriptional LysR family regulator
MLNRKYRYLIALAQARHFGRAAAACNVSPSTLSAAISDLESDLGFAVVERGKNFSDFTREGALLLDYALKISDTVNTLQQELSLHRGKLTGHLRIGVIPTALTAIAFLSDLFYRRHPGVTLEILSQSTGEILNNLSRFDIDAGIIYQDEQLESSLSVTPLWHEPHVLLTPDTDRFSGRSNATWREAAALNLCLLTPDMKNRQIIDAIFKSVGCTVAPQMVTNSIISMLAHISTGSWSGIFPQSVIEMIGAPPNTLALPLIEPTKYWKIGLATVRRDTTPPILQALVEQIESLGSIFGKAE